MQNPVTAPQTSYWIVEGDPIPGVTKTISWPSNEIPFTPKSELERSLNNPLYSPGTPGKILFQVIESVIRPVTAKVSVQPSAVITLPEVEGVGIDCIE